MVVVKCGFVVCVGCGASGLRKVGLKRGVAACIGELQREKCVLVVRVGRQLGSRA